MFLACTIRFKSFRSFAGAQVDLSLVVRSLSAVVAAVGGGWCAVCVATAPVANALVLNIVQIQTRATNFTPLDHVCSSNSRWSSQVVCSQTTGWQRHVVEDVLSAQLRLPGDH